jgi:hypothetical protein
MRDPDRNVMLNAFQHPSRLAAGLALAEGWTLKQVQGDDSSGVGASDGTPT